MKEKFAMLFIFIFTFIILVDLYSFKGIKILVENINLKYIKYTIFFIYWLIPVIIISFLLIFRAYQPLEREPRIFKHFFLLAGTFLLFYIPKLVFIAFHLVDDLVYVVKYIISKFSTNTEIELNQNINGISRATFITQLGLIVAAIPFTSILYGMIKGRFNFRIVNETIHFHNLPVDFENFKIVQISDIHIGSFLGHENKVTRAIDLVNDQNPDLILFTGDLVNNFAEELNGWVPILSKLKAKYGLYSILGNHDYGDYFDWKNMNEKEQNLQKLIHLHKQIGFNLLLNDSAIIKKDNSEIALIGVENWGLPPFPQHGDLKKALINAINVPFKILMSHDPSHWDVEVLDKTDINLTLSGHTHGMQFGIEIGNIKWSPVKYKYPRWAGLYKESNQYLYVNRGFGNIGYPGRVGMPPEITVIELKKA